MLKKRDLDQTIIGKGAQFSGQLRVPGLLFVDGHIEGGLECEGAVTFGEHGKLDGTLTCRGDLTVAGHVDGIIAVHGHLHVKSGGQVSGEVGYQSLEVERGGAVHGTTCGVEALQQRMAQSAPDIAPEASKVTALEPPTVAEQAS
ncbi:MAG: bactofilin family protein [Polyangiales bacterium]